MNCAMESQDVGTVTSLHMFKNKLKNPEVWLDPS